MSILNEQDLMVDTVVAAETVHQTNRYDCGVLKMLFVQYLSKGLPLTFTCDGCLDARKRFAYEINRKTTYIKSYILYRWVYKNLKSLYEAYIRGYIRIKKAYMRLI